MTKFINLGQLPEEQNKKRKTVFTHILEYDKEMIECDGEAEDYDVVMFLGHDDNYGDVFKASNDNSPNIFTILLGIKGDEFEL
jgi:hypothetical protein